MPVDDLAPEYENNQEDWQLIRDVVAGAKAVRKGRYKYLPQLSDMGWAEYEAYSKRAQFFNATARTTNGLIGAIFRKEPEIILGEAESLRPELENCTNDMQPFNVLARCITRETLTMGRVGALVDAPAGGGKPYFATYPTETITNWRLIKTANGRITADQVVLKEEIYEPNTDGFGSKKTDIFRELVLDSSGTYVQNIWMPVKKADNTYTYGIAQTVQPVISGAGSFRNEMPFVCFGPAKTGLPVQKSPILDIAELNVLHFQRSAQLAHGQFYTATPTYWAVAPLGNAEMPEYRVGPNTVWMVDQPNACGILEYTGSGLSFLESACSQLESQMASLGARLASDRRGIAAEAAEAAELRNKGETSLLFELISGVEKGLTELLKIWVRWHGRNPKDVQVKMNRDFVGMALEYRTWLQLDRAHARGDIDDETYYRALFEGDILPVGYGPTDLKSLIENAPANRAKAAEETRNLKAE